MDRPRYCSWAPDTLLRDPIVRRMSAEAFGAYCSLLVEAWLAGGGLPDDPAELAALSRLGRSWQKHERAVMSQFALGPDAKWHSAIVDESLARAVGRSDQARAAVAERERRRGVVAREQSEQSRREAHRAQHEAAYAEHIARLVAEAASAPEYVESWRLQAEATLARRSANGMSGAVRHQRSVLDDPEMGRADRERLWRKAYAGSLPDYWSWDAEHNPEAYRPRDRKNR